MPESHPCLISMRPRALDCGVDAWRVKPLGVVGMSARALHSRRMCILGGQKMECYRLSCVLPNSYVEVLPPIAIGPLRGVM